jgi:hypothetical protein
MPEMSVTRGTKITRAVLRRERTCQRRATHSHSLSYVRSKQRLRSYNCGKIGSARAQQLRQLGDIGCDPPGLVAGEQMRRRPPSRLLLAIDVSERLPVGVADNEAGVRFAGSGAVLAAQHGDQRSWGYRNHDDGVLSTTNRADLTFAEATQTRLAARRQALGARPLPPLRRP